MSPSIILALSIADLAALLLAAILCLDVVWHTRGKLDIFAKLLTGVVVVRIGERLFNLLNFSALTTNQLPFIGLIMDLLLIGSVIELYRMVRSLENQT